MSNTHSNRPLRIALMLGAAITFIFFILLLCNRPPTEPKYDGRDLGQWVRSAEEHSNRDPAILAIRVGERNRGRRAVESAGRLGDPSSNPPCARSSSRLSIS